jgi:hypothetical protein
VNCQEFTKYKSQLESISRVRWELSVKFFLNLAQSLFDYRYIYLSQDNILIIMIPTMAHENVIATLRDMFRDAMVSQEAQNPSLMNTWQLHMNKLTFYKDGDESEF